MADPVVLSQGELVTDKGVAVPSSAFVNISAIATEVAADPALTAVFAPLAAPTFTGDAKAVTPAVGDNDTSVATTAFLSPAWTAVLGGVGFQNSWANFGSGFQVAQYRKVGTDVEIRGVVAGGGANTVFTLPAGFRPASIQMLSAYSQATVGSRIDVNTDGTVVMTAGSGGVYNALDCRFSTL